MAIYLLRRAVTAAVVLLGISMVTFALLHIMSPSPGRDVLGLQASRASVAAFNRAHGFDRPLISQYLSYMNQLVHGNLGYSYKLNQSVDALLSENAGRTAMLVGVSLVIAIAIAVPLGIFQAVKRNKAADNVVTALAFTAYSMPSFFLGLLLIDLFALRLHLVNAEASQSTSAFVIFTDPRSMVLPVATMAAVSVAMYSRYQRSATLDQLAQDYIRLARAKGLPARLVLTRHLVRNACLPMVTLIGLSVPLLLAGNLVIESVFNYPGLGLLFFNSLQSDDYPVLLAYTLVSGALTVLGNLAADISLALSDPRIELA
ncbi:MAG TPA: ABC transporter permease [Streptosporangiaceae bacterium]|jgi:peptide/nickel transport system permease protein|nr:ABC transporter permease [Streptosporangiaceae bacterium]HTA02680.1 ABC transporter permease [Streptosporangiaceae bacterium]